MQYTQLLAFEVTDLCNRGHEHKSCPNKNPLRWKYSRSSVPVPDEKVVEIALKMHSGGFKGCICFHHYCEPLMDWPRVKRLTTLIRTAIPESKFILWTNGDLFPEDLTDYCDIFSGLIITNYANRNLDRLKAVCQNLYTVGPGLDWRVEPPKHSGRERCVRPYLEFVVDYFGNVRPCCMDWQGELSIGNAQETPFEELWGRWVALRKQLSTPQMDIQSPIRCLTCGTRFNDVAGYVPEIAEEARRHFGC